MAQNNTQILKIFLIFFALASLVYGFCYVFIPTTLVEISKGPPVNPGWLRWAGGVLLSLGIGALMVFRKPKGQSIFVTTICLGSLFTGLALLYSWVTKEYGGATWFIAAPTILILVISVFLWWGRAQAKETLKSD